MKSRVPLVAAVVFAVAGAFAGAGGCSGGGKGARECSASSDCDGGLLCDHVDGQCVACRTTADCGATERCDGGQCVATDPCGSTADCSGGLVCGDTTGTCVACNSYEDCGGKPCLGNSCVDFPACQNDKDCADLDLTCEEALPPEWSGSYLGMGCQECADSSDCPDDGACVEGLCYDICEQEGRICGDAQGADCGSCPDGQVCAGDGTMCIEDLGSIPENQPQRLLVGTSSVFLVGPREKGGTVWELPFGGTASEFGSTSSADYLEDGAINSSQVFWVGTDGAVKAEDQSGGHAQTVQTVADDCWEMIADDENVYCARRDYSNASSTNGLGRFPVGGGSITMMVTGDTPQSLVQDGDRIYMSFFNEGVSGWCKTTNESFHEVDDTIQAEYVLPGGDDLYLYGERSGDYGLWRAPIDGGTPELVVAEQEFPIAWWNGGLFLDVGGTLVRYDPETGEFETIETEVLFTHAAPDGEGNLYVTSASGSGVEVYRIPLP